MVVVAEDGPRLKLPFVVLAESEESSLQDVESLLGAEKVLLSIGCSGDKVGVA